MIDISDYYQIIRQRLFEDQIRNICDNYKRMSEIDSAIDWALSRFNREKLSEDVVEIRSNYFMWIQPSFSISDTPNLRIIFYVNELKKSITLIEISEE